MTKAIGLYGEDDLFRAAAAKATLQMVVKLQKINTVHQDLKRENLVMQMDWDKASAAFKATGMLAVPGSTVLSGG